MTLEEERKACLDRAQALLDTVQSEGREMTPEEQEAYDKDIARAEEINNQLEQEAQRMAKLKEAQERALKIRRSVVNPISMKGTFDGGQNERDLDKFSLGRALRCMVNRQNVDGVEGEVFQEGAKESRSCGVAFDTRAMVIPAEALRKIAQKHSKRATTVTSTSGDTVTNEAYPNIFEMYRDRQILTKLGAQVFDGLVGTVKISTQTSSGTALSVSTETGTATSLDPELNMVELSPNRIAAYTAISNQLILQSSPNIESFAVNNLMKSIITAFQKEVFQGSSGSSIVGIPNITGVNTSNVATANSPTWGEILAMVESLAGLDFDIERSGFAVAPSIMTTLMSTLKSTNNFEFIMSEFFNADGLKSLAGLKAAVSSSVANTSLIFGAWDSLFIGQWGGIGIIVDPYTLATTGSIQVVAESFMDAQVGNPDLFSVLSMSVA